MTNILCSTVFSPTLKIPPKYWDQLGFWLPELDGTLQQPLKWWGSVTETQTEKKKPLHNLMSHEGSCYVSWTAAPTSECRFYVLTAWRHGEGRDKWTCWSRHLRSALHSNSRKKHWCGLNGAFNSVPHKPPSCYRHRFPSASSTGVRASQSDRGRKEETRRIPFTEYGYLDRGIKELWARVGGGLIARQKGLFNSDETRALSFSLSLHPSECVCVSSSVKQDNSVLTLRIRTSIQL